MGENDVYTQKVREWSYVKQRVAKIKRLIKDNPEEWEKRHMSTPDWKPSLMTGFVPTPDDNAKHLSWISHPKGTGPGTAFNAWNKYLKEGIITKDLWYSAIGSFTIFSTVDKIDPACKTATIRFWMFNAMNQRSMGGYRVAMLVRLYYEGAQGMAQQEMWWNWTEEYDWSEGRSSSSGDAGYTGKEEFFHWGYIHPSWEGTRDWVFDNLLW